MIKGIDYNFPFINLYVDLCVYSMLQFYFMPAILMSQGTEIEQWISKVSTNGIKQ
jgi:hypothetical protein